MHPRHVDSIFNELGFRLKSSKKNWLMETEKQDNKRLMEGRDGSQRPQC